MITGDHGMGSIDQTIFIDDFGVDGDRDLLVIETTPNLNAFVHNATQWPVILQKLRAIPHANVYRRDDIPDRWHYKRNRRVPDLLVVPEIGYSVVCLIFKFTFDDLLLLISRNPKIINSPSKVPVHMTPL